jgi:hypothetical protein
MKFTRKFGYFEHPKRVFLRFLELGDGGIFTVSTSIALWLCILINTQ